MKTLILDCNYLCHRASHSTGNLKSGNINTGVIYGFLEALINTCETFSTDQVLFIWDSRGSIRKKYFPAYKEKRHKDKSPEEKLQAKACYQQIDLLRTKILPKLGFVNHFLQEDLEGDDVMASIVFDERYKHKEFIIVGNDKDLYQLLSSHCTMWVPGKGMYTVKTLKEEFGVSPEEWIRVKSIGGCSSDEVPGIANPNPSKPENKVRNIGEGTAVRYLKGELGEHTQAFKNITSKVGKAKEKFNELLVKLPHPMTGEFFIQEDKCSVKKFKKLCKKYEFKRFLKERMDEWERLLEGGY